MHQDIRMTWHHTSKQLLLPLIYGRFRRPFLSKLESILPYWERLLTSGNYSRQMAIFLGVAVSPPWGKTVQCSENLQNICVTSQTPQVLVTMVNIKAHYGTIRKSSGQRSNSAVERWWSGCVLQPQDLGTLKSLSQSWTPLYRQVFQSQLWNHLSDRFYNNFTEQNG